MDSSERQDYGAFCAFVHAGCEIQYSFRFYDLQEQIAMFQQFLSLMEAPERETMVSILSYVIYEGKRESNPHREVDLEAKEDQNCEEQQPMGDFQQPEEEQAALAPSREAGEGEGALNSRGRVNLGADLDQICGVQQQFAEEQQLLGDFQQPLSQRRPREIVHKAPIPSYGRNEGKGAQNQRGKWVFQGIEDQFREEQQQQPPEEEFQQPFTRRESKAPMVLDDENLEPQAETRKTRSGGWESSGGNPNGLLNGAQLEGDRREEKRFDFHNLENPDLEIRFDSLNLENPDLEDFVGPIRNFVGPHPLFDEGTPQGGAGTLRHPLVSAPGHPPWLNKPPDPLEQQLFQPRQQSLEAPPHLHEGPNASREVQQGTSHVSKEAPPYWPPQIVFLPPQNQDSVQLGQQQVQSLQQHLEAHPHLYVGSKTTEAVQHVTSEEAPPSLHTKIDCFSPQHRDTVQIVGLDQQQEAQMGLTTGFKVPVEVPPDPTHLGYGAAPYLHPNITTGHHQSALISSTSYHSRSSLRHNCNNIGAPMQV